VTASGIRGGYSRDIRGASATLLLGEVGSGAVFLAAFPSSLSMTLTSNGVIHAPPVTYICLVYGGIGGAK